MIVGIILSSSPVQMAAITSFAAPDPWNGNKPAQMTLSVYRMVNDRYLKAVEPYARKARQTVVDGMHLRTAEVLGLRSSLDGRYHILPIALMRLWQKGAIGTEDLPRVLAEAERGTSAADYLSHWDHPLFRLLHWTFTAVGAVLLVAAALLWTRHTPTNSTDPAAWVLCLMLAGIFLAGAASVRLLLALRKRRLARQQASFHSRFALA